MLVCQEPRERASAVPEPGGWKSEHKFARLQAALKARSALSRARGVFSSLPPSFTSPDVASFLSSFHLFSCCCLLQKAGFRLGVGERRPPSVERQTSGERKF